MKQMEVSIMGQIYLLACPEGGDAVLAEAVTRVDREMCAIRDAGRVKARERIAVLAALNIAYALSELRHSGGTPMPLPPPPPPAPPPITIDVDGLVRRIEASLGAEGMKLE
ncbi:cell division protein ZapA [Sphaerotilus sulfidivorans]|nr:MULTISPECIES: cell division protein ZapA [Sphaerotilus]MCK6400655.1 cell division protein ZapA [Sphaerotilus sulfidivorans]NZD46286.1 cell division protein ZapA [Sphaerotilus sulfidivorans]QEN02672.1 cell division protein ZapA [Sphaerotilus sulfidivorans]